MILVAIFIHGEQGRSCCRLDTDDALAVSDIGSLVNCPVSQGVKQLVCLEPFVVAIPRFHAVDDLKLVFRLIPAENVFLYDVRRLNRGQRHRRSVGGKKFESNQINRLIGECV